jgi:hypothetical protein
MMQYDGISMHYGKTERIQCRDLNCDIKSPLSAMKYKFMSLEIFSVHHRSIYVSSV